MIPSPICEFFANLGYAHGDISNGMHTKRKFCGFLRGQRLLPNLQGEKHALPYQLMHKVRQYSLYTAISHASSLLRMFSRGKVVPGGQFERASAVFSFMVHVTEQSGRRLRSLRAWALCLRLLARHINPAMGGTSQDPSLRLAFAQDVVAYAGLFPRPGGYVNRSPPVLPPSSPPPPIIAGPPVVRQAFSYKRVSSSVPAPCPLHLEMW